jgi:hypothetical protein
MAWQMLRVALQIIKTDRDIAQTPFAAVCAVLRGAIAVLETRTDDDRIAMTRDDLEGMGKIMRLFAKRWRIGETYMTRLEELFGSVVL